MKAHRHSSDVLGCHHRSLVAWPLPGCRATAFTYKLEFQSAELETPSTNNISQRIPISSLKHFKMVATRSRTQPKEEEAIAGGGIKAPARRGRAKKAESEVKEEAKPNTATKKAVPKGKAKAVAKKEPELEPEPELEQETEVQEEAPKVETKKPAPRGRAKAATKTEPEPETKVAKRSTRAAPVPTPAQSTIMTKTRKTSQTKAKTETAAPKKLAKKAELEEKPKTRGRKGSGSKKQVKAEEEKQLATVVEVTAEAEEQSAAIEDEKQGETAAQQVTLKPGVESPKVQQPSKLPLPAQPASPTKSTSPSHSMKGSPLKPATTLNFRSSVLASPEKSLGSPRKPPVAPKLLNSPPRSRSGSPFRISHIEAPSVRRFNIQSPFRPPLLRPVASESQLSLSARKQVLIAPSVVQRPSTSAGPSAGTSPTKSSLKAPGMLSPKKSVSFDHGTPEKIEAPLSAPETPKAMTIECQAVGLTEVQEQTQEPVQALPPPTPKPQILTGLTFYVDVRDHRTGADASALFTPLLLDLGAAVVPTWSSNSDAVTHVLFKDGDIMTLEKVVAAAGSVKAVNIGWILDCEREGKRLADEGYEIDLSPVLGAITPKALINTPRSMKSAKSVSVVATPTAKKTPAREVMAEIEFPTIAGLRIKTPSFAASNGAAETTTPFVPGANPNAILTTVDEMDKENLSPVITNANAEQTPLMQKSCPAKQERKPLFAVNVIGEKDGMTPLKRKLLGAKRRETMAPKMG